METRRIQVTLIDEMLGTNPSDEKIYSKFIASKAPDAKTMEEDLQTMSTQEMEQNNMTIFIKDKDGNPMMPAYHMYGFFKSACGYLKKVKDTKSEKIKAYKKFIDGLVFVNERKIPLIFDGEVQNLQRPLRASTMQGERVALANSEMLPEGTTCEFTIKTLKGDLIPTIKEWLDYGELNGLGQWHNSGAGAFKWEEIA